MHPGRRRSSCHLCDAVVVPDDEHCPAVRSSRPRTKEPAMCRWMAWFGQPVPVEDVLFKTPHGIVDQSLHSRLGAETTNGDGFGLGWYGRGDVPGVYHSVEPA